jgi:hypothetical protein
MNFLAKKTLPPRFVSSFFVCQCRVISTVGRGFPLAAVAVAGGAGPVDSGGSSSSSSDTEPLPSIDADFNSDDA